MNPLASELNAILRRGNVHLADMLSEVGKNLFFPKGILSQSAEAKEKAHRFNATIGMATEKGRTMHLPSVMALLRGLEPEEALTYAPSFGLMPLRMAWQAALLAKNPSLEGHEISLPVVTQAITHGLSVVADMWIDPGDVLVLPDKTWGNYHLIFGVRRGAQVVSHALFDAAGAFNVAAFDDCLRAQADGRDKVVVLLNFPNNPTGYTPTPAEADAIADCLVGLAEGGTDVVAVIDDAYFGLFYDERSLQESIFPRLLDRHPRLLAIKLDGGTKENYIWGLRVGFITYGAVIAGEIRPVYDALERKTAGNVRGSISNASHLSQEILLRSLQAPTFAAEKAEKYALMKGRADEIRRVLADPKYAAAWEAYPFNSGYFMCLRLKTVEAEPLRVHLLDRYGVGLISLGKTDLRIAFSCLEQGNIQELFDTVLRGVNDLGGRS
ncbi:MAG TPA: aminotransferase class I/II-fold pyridoxal phosphate-dependent enzyme [bacterium]|jgi:aspartate/methionine/tyrosine aminotransferase